MEEQAIKTPEERANEVITEAHMMLGTLCSLARFDTEVEVTLKQFRERLEVVWGLSATATLSNGLKELQMANMIVVEPQKKRRVTQAGLDEMARVAPEYEIMLAARNIVEKRPRPREKGESPRETAESPPFKQIKVTPAKTTPVKRGELATKSQALPLQMLPPATHNSQTPPKKHTFVAPFVAPEMDVVHSGEERREAVSAINGPSDQNASKESKELQSPSSPSSVEQAQVEVKQEVVVVVEEPEALQAWSPHSSSPEKLAVSPVRPVLVAERSDVAMLDGLLPFAGGNAEVALDWSRAIAELGQDSPNLPSDARSALLLRERLKSLEGVSVEQWLQSLRLPSREVHCAMAFLAREQIASIEQIFHALAREESRSPFLVRGVMFLSALIPELFAVMQLPVK